MGRLTVNPFSDLLRHQIQGNYLIWQMHDHLEMHFARKRNKNERDLCQTEDPMRTWLNTAPAVAIVRRRTEAAESGLKVTASGVGVTLVRSSPEARPYA